jgi:tryptophanyl-tRNA synthetase
MPVPKLEQLPTYKDKKARYGSPGFGLLAYPILMASDIMIYKADTVPVGKDQLPHIEFTREVVRRFNQTFGDIFREPEARLNDGAYVPSLTGKGAMSKSNARGNIDLADDPGTIQRKLARATTDPARIRRGDPGEPARCPVYAIHACFTPQERLASMADDCRSAAIGCVECKSVLADGIIRELAPIQARRAELLALPEVLRNILGDGAAACRPRARKTLDEVRQRMGID